LKISLLLQHLIFKQFPLVSLLLLGFKLLKFLFPLISHPLLLLVQ
jgi:hypothetical protein